MSRYLELRPFWWLEFWVGMSVALSQKLITSAHSIKLPKPVQSHRSPLLKLQIERLKLDPNAPYERQKQEAAKVVWLKG